WKGEPPYNLKGNFFEVTTATRRFRRSGRARSSSPTQNPHPPTGVTPVAPPPKGVTEAAKRGWTPISANFLLPEWVASHWPKYLEGCLSIDKKPDGRDWRVAKSIFVADDEKTAREYGHGP